MKALATLAAGLFLIGLSTSRIMLVLHEMVGHGAVAVLLGSEITGHRFFLFGGGFVTYRRATAFSVSEGLMVSLGGIALELVLGVAALIALRRASSVAARVALAGFALAVMLHAGFYLATGTHYAYGDGRRLAQVLGAGRPLFVAILSLALVALAFVLAGRLMRAMAPWLTAPSRAGRLAMAVIAAGVAGLVHGGLMLVEQRLTADATYARIMRPEVVTTPPFPLKPLLWAGLGVATFAGAYRATAVEATGSGAAGTVAALRPIGVVALASMLLVIVFRG